MTSYQYDPVGFLTDIQRPNGVDTIIAPNVRNQVDLITHSKSGTLQFFDYELDKAGNRTQVTESGGVVIQWDYDNLYRLTDETRNGVNTHFTYDDAGNRESMTVGSTTTNYTYNALDQLTNAGSVTYGYDDRGNLNQITNGSQITNYTYDAADRLATVVLPDSTNIAYSYDADGRRVKQTVGSQITNYLWDESSPYGDVVLETNGSGGMLVSYVLGGTGLVSQNSSGTTNYYLQDGQGSTRGLTNSTGTVTDTYSYTAFGELFNQTGTTTNNYLYTGQQFDSLTGLYSLRARYYAPGLGRFLSQDTYPVNFGNPVELNRYGYTGNNPINLVDPSGLNSTFEYIGITGTLALSVGGLSLTATQAFVSDAVLAAFVSYMLVAPSIGSLPFPQGGFGRPIGKELQDAIITVATLYLILLNAQDIDIENVDVDVDFKDREPEYIYREGPNRAKSLRLYRSEDYKTGLSFSVDPFPPPKGSIKFRVDKLRANGYIVNFDGNDASVLLPFLGGGLYMGIRITLPWWHVTVYYNNKDYWEKWYNDEQKNIGKPNATSWQTDALYELQER